MAPQWRARLARRAAASFSGSAGVAARQIRAPQAAIAVPASCRAAFRGGGAYMARYFHGLVATIEPQWRESLSSSQLSSQKIYEKLRQKILEFEIYPGTRITEVELANAFKVSRTPVRQALQRLAVEGHITIQPKQGCFVRGVDIEKISAYYDVRVHLEAAAVELACQHMSDDELDALTEIWNPARVKRSINMEEVKALEEAFHIAIATGSGNPVLVDYLEDINHHIRILRRLGFPDRKAVLETYEEHYELCQLLRQRNARAARKAMTEHIRKSQEIARGVTLTQLQQAIRRGNS
jgi:DNA-binding GntR family transcriptional regulator